MINALDLNCQIIALNTPFNIEMLENKKVIFFEKNINSVSNSFKTLEKSYDDLIHSNKDYIMPLKYNWDHISNEYLKLFYRK